jgi:phenylacetate-CoA ligase
MPGNAPASLMPRHDRILGRSDDMFIFRAVNIYPVILTNTLQHQEVGSEYQIRLTGRQRRKDHMTIRGTVTGTENPTTPTSTSARP